MSKVSEINKLILALTSLDEIRAASDALRFRHKQLQQVAAYSFGVGAEVKFVARDGRTIFGTIIKISAKTVTVHEKDRGVGTLTWRVTPSLLRAASAAA